MGEAIEVLKSTRLAAIVQAPKREDLIASAIAAAEGGIRLLALPVSIPFVAEIAAEVSDETDVIVGLSGVISSEHLNLAMAAGVEFVFSPVFDPELVEAGKGKGLDVLPSVSTPNELYNARRIYQGLMMIAPSHGLGGTAYVGWMARTFPDLPLVASGGVGSDSAPDYLEQGAAAVVVDRGLFPQEMEPESAMIITARASALVEMCSGEVELEL